MFVRPSVCPSVRPERFPGICRRMHGGIGLKFYMLMYFDHPQNWLVCGRGVLIFLIFGAILTRLNGSNLGFPDISQRTHGGNGLKFYTLMYLEPLQNRLVYGLGLLIILILALLWLSKRVKFGVSGHFLENALREWPKIWYAAVSWPPSELIRLW